jgi:hypothetical protein
MRKFGFGGSYMIIRYAMSAAMTLMTASTVALAQAQPGTILWTYDAPALIRSSPAVAPEGTVYFSADASLYAITNMGSNKWTFTLDGNRCGSAAVGANGVVYIASGAAGRLYGIRADGALQWSFQTGGGNASPALGRDDAIYTFGYVMFYSVSAIGAERWRYPVGGTAVFSSPAVNAAENIYVSSPELTTLYSLNANGTARWAYSLDRESGDSPAVGYDGTVFITAGPLCAISSSGTKLWASQTNDFAHCSPVIGTDGTIYASTSRGSLCAFTPSGEFKWQVLTNGYTPGTSPAIDSAGTIYYSAYSVLYAISPAGTVVWSVPLLHDPGDMFGTSVTSPAIGPDGTIYVTSANRLYAIYNTNKLADSAWPMYRQNARHTGKIEKSSLQQAKKRAEGGFQLQVVSQIDQPFTVQSSTNLVNWLDFTNMVCTNVPMDVIDASPPVAAKFYRAYTQ